MSNSLFWFTPLRESLGTTTEGKPVGAPVPVTLPNDGESGSAHPKELPRAKTGQTSWDTFAKFELPWIL